MKRNVTVSVLDIMAIFLGDYRLKDVSSVKRGAVLTWSASQIALNTGLPERSVYRFLKEMVSHGIIEKVGEGYRISSRILWNLYDYQTNFNKEKERTIWLQSKSKK